jgi:bleomycin hydrolase
MKESLKAGLILGLAATLVAPSFAQKKKSSDSYEFTNTLNLEATSIKNQEITGTCWSYSTASFLESEVMKATGKEVDLSEMYFVRLNYMRKAENYIRRQGATNFGEGSLSHDVIESMRMGGALPESLYGGNNYGTSMHNHGELEAVLKAMLDAYVNNPNGKLSNAWREAINGVLDAYLGEVPAEFEYEGETYTPETFANSLGIDLDNYVTVTSFMHHPYGQDFILEIPDNWSSGTYTNMQLEPMMTLMNKSLDAGHTVAWDADVSEKTWSTKHGIAIWPETEYRDMTKDEREDMFKSPVPEMEIEEGYRQAAYEDYSTTDDHLMHIIGRAVDQKGNKYYLVKNSWGTKRGIDGYFYISESYMRMKTIAFMINKTVM